MSTTWLLGMSHKLKMWNCLTSKSFFLMILMVWHGTKTWKLMSLMGGNTTAIYLVNYIHFYQCLQLRDWSSTSPQPVETETGWDRSFNCKKLTKTALNQLTSVQSGFLWFSNLWGLVSVPVLSNFDERLDWTRLPSTTAHRLSAHLGTSRLGTSPLCMLPLHMSPLTSVTHR